MIRNKILPVLITLFILSSTVYATDILTLNDFIQTAVKTHPKYQISAEDYLIAIKENQGAKAADDWNLIATAVYQDTHPAPTSGFSADYQKTMGYTLGLSKYVSQTGTAIQLEHGNTKVWADYTPVTIPGIGTLDFFPDSPYYVSNLSLTISQPLLKNGFGLASRLALDISDSSLRLSKIKLMEDWEDFIATLRDDYTAWQLRKLNIAAYEEKVKTVEDQLALTKRQYRYGLAEEVDLVQIKQKLQSYKIMLERAQMNYETQTKKILRILKKNDLALDALKPEKFVKSSLALSSADAVNYLASESSIYKIADILVEIQRKNKEIKENATLPELNLVAVANPNMFTQNFSDSISRIGSYQEYTITVSGSKTLGAGPEGAEAEKARAEYEKAKMVKEETLLNAQNGLAELYTGLEYTENMLKLLEKNNELAKKRFALEQKKYKQGRTSIFFVLQAEDDALQAQNLLNDTLFAREKLINQIKAFTDQYQKEHQKLLEIN